LRFSGNRADLCSLLRTLLRIVFNPLILSSAVAYSNEVVRSWPLQAGDLQRAVDNASLRPRSFARNTQSELPFSFLAARLCKALQLPLKMRIM
jgi:hypothetical protein